MIDYPTLNDEEFEDIFDELSRQYYWQSCMHSFSHAMIAVPAGQEIIKMGKRAVPLILEKYSNHHSMTYCALLEEILQIEIPLSQTPVMVGIFAKLDVDEVAHAWIAWGKINGFDLSPS